MFLLLWERLLQNANHKENAKQKADEFRNGKCEPNEVELLRKREQERHGDEDDELSSNADYKAVDALSEGLTGGACNDGEAGEDEGVADYTKGGSADL